MKLLIPWNPPRNQYSSHSTSKVSMWWSNSQLIITNGQQERVLSLVRYRLSMMAAERLDTNRLFIATHFDICLCCYISFMENLVTPEILICIAIVLGGMTFSYQRSSFVFSSIIKWCRMSMVASWEVQHID